MDNLLSCALAPITSVTQPPPSTTATPDYGRGDGEKAAIIGPVNCSLMEGLFFRAVNIAI